MIPDFWHRKCKQDYDVLRDRLETVERQVKRAELDWDELYEKMRRLLGRINKRAERSTDEPAAATPPVRRLSAAEFFANRGHRALPPR